MTHTLAHAQHVMAIFTGERGLISSLSDFLCRFIASLCVLPAQAQILDILLDTGP